MELREYNIRDHFSITNRFLHNRFATMIVLRLVLNLRRAGEKQAEPRANIPHLASIQFNVSRVLGNIGEPVRRPGEDEEDFDEPGIDEACLETAVQNSIADQATGIFPASAAHPRSVAANS